MPQKRPLVKIVPVGVPRQILARPTCTFFYNIFHSSAKKIVIDVLFYSFFFLLSSFFFLFSFFFFLLSSFFFLLFSPVTNVKNRPTNVRLASSSRHLPRRARSAASEDIVIRSVKLSARTALRAHSPRRPARISAHRALPASTMTKRNKTIARAAPLESTPQNRPEPRPAPRVPSDFTANQRQAVPVRSVPGRQLPQCQVYRRRIVVSAHLASTSPMTPFARTVTPASSVELVPASAPTAPSVSTLHSLTDAHICSNSRRVNSVRRERPRTASVRMDLMMRVTARRASTHRCQ